MTEPTQYAYEEGLEVQEAVEGDTSVTPLTRTGGPQDDGLTPRFEEPHLQPGE